jgi:predicted MFS family arabinose efflux permease
MRRKSKKIDPRKKSIVRILFYLNAILWLVYSIYTYFDMAVVNHNELSADIATIYVFVNAIAMFVSGLILGKLQGPSFYFAIVVAILNIILTILNLTDLIFMIAFVLDIAIVWLLMNIRDGYLLKS